LIVLFLTVIVLSQRTNIFSFAKPISVCYKGMTSCAGNKIYACEGGISKLKTDCGLSGKICTTSNGKAACVSPPATPVGNQAYTICENDRIYTCRTGSGCKVKVKCKNGCTKSMYQLNGTPKGDAECLNARLECAGSKIVACDGDKFKLWQDCCTRRCFHVTGQAPYCGELPDE